MQLTDKNAVKDIDIGCWITATKHTVRISHILGNLIRTVENTGQANMLLIAAALGAYTDDADVAFWEILSRIDRDGELLGNAMVITAQIYSGSDLIDDLTELQIINGNIVYNRIERGIFETIYSTDQGNIFEFYLYSTDYYPTDK